MSNVFLKNDLNGILDTITESNMSLPSRINIVDIANKSSKSTNLDKTNYSVTSSAVVNQAGGGYSATSTNSNSIRDVNKLISMLTSESSTNSMSETSSVTLENKNSNSNKNKQRNNYGFRGGGHNNISVNDVKTFFKNFKVNNKNVNVKINDQNMSEFFNTKLIGGGGKEEEKLNKILLDTFNNINNSFMNNKLKILQLDQTNIFVKSINTGITDYYNKIKSLLGIGTPKTTYNNDDYLKNSINNEIINSFDTVNKNLTIIIYAIEHNKYNNIKKYYNETLNQSILAIERLINEKKNKKNNKLLYEDNKKEYYAREAKYRDDYDDEKFANDHELFLDIVYEYGGDNVIFT
jgi:hypothetical protein